LYFIYVTIIIENRKNNKKRLMNRKQKENNIIKNQRKALRINWSVLFTLDAIAKHKAKERNFYVEKSDYSWFS